MPEGRAEILLKNVNIQAASLAKTDSLAEQGYAHLGWMMLEVAEMQYWKIKYDSFTDYLKTVAQIAHKTPGQLRQYFLTVRDLSSTFTAEQLEEMGITKAIKVRQAKDYAIVLPHSIIKAALDQMVSAKELRKLISVELKVPDEEGDWFDLDGFYVTIEERKLIESAMNAARHIEPVVKATIAESAQMKEIVIRWCMEFLATYGEPDAH